MGNFFDLRNVAWVLVHTMRYMLRYMYVYMGACDFDVQCIAHGYNRMECIKCDHIHDFHFHFVDLRCRTCIFEGMRCGTCCATCCATWWDRVFIPAVYDGFSWFVFSTTSRNRSEQPCLTMEIASYKSILRTRSVYPNPFRPMSEPPAEQEPEHNPPDTTVDGPVPEAGHADQALTQLTPTQGEESTTSASVTGAKVPAETEWDDETVNLAEHVEREFDLPIDDVKFDVNQKFGQVRGITPSHVADLVATISHKFPKSPHESVMWLDEATGNYYCLSGQHFISAVKQVRATWPPGKEQYRWMTHIRALQLKQSVPLRLRIKIAGRENLKDSSGKRCTDVELVAMYQKYRDPKRSWSANLLEAAVWAAKDVDLRQQYLRQSKLTTMYTETDWKKHV